MTRKNESFAGRAPSSVVLCGSLDFTEQMSDAASELREMGFSVVLPETARLVLDGSVSLSAVLAEKASGRIVRRTIRQDTLRAYYSTIADADAVLVLNYPKGPIENYVGGHVLVEMAFAHVLRKRLFLLNPLPDLPYRDVIEAMQAVILYGDVGAVGQHMLPIREPIDQLEPQK